MKKHIFLSIILSICLFSNNLLLSGNNLSPSNHNDKQICNFVEKRLAKNFNLDELKEMYKAHSEEALNLYNIATESLSNLENKVPHEVLTNIKTMRYYSFVPFKFKESLYNKCAYGIANGNLAKLTKPQASLVNAIRSIGFHLQTNKCYDRKLAKFLIKIHLDLDYKPSRECLDKCLCTAAFLGDIVAVELLLSLGANSNFVNPYDNLYTPLAYALIQEHGYSKIKNKSNHIYLLIKFYEKIAQMLIKAGARADLQIYNGVSGNHLNKTYIFMQTSNVKIFNLFEDQIINKVELTDEFGCNLVMNAFKLGNVEFIKKLYSNPLYRNSPLARTNYDYHTLRISRRSFLDLAIKYYKGYDFKELYNFLIENDEGLSSDHNFNVTQFGLICLQNAIAAFDYECINSLYQSGIRLTIIRSDLQWTTLIQCIKIANKQTDKKNLIKIIELFMAAGVNFYHEDIWDMTALDYAFAKNKDYKKIHKTINNVMLLNNSNPDLTGEEIGNYLPKEQLHDDIIQALIMTPLIYAIRTSPFNIQAGLIELINLVHNEYEGNIESYRDSNGKTALDYATELNLDSAIIYALKSTIIPNFHD